MTPSPPRSARLPDRSAQAAAPPFPDQEGAGDPCREAFELAVAAIGRKQRTERELRVLLADRGVEPEAADDALDRLIAIGEIDDQRFARLYAEDKRELRGWGPERIRSSLRERGVSPREADVALAHEDRAETRARAIRMLTERGRPLASDRERASAMDYLVRLGYDHELAYEAIRAAGRVAD